VKKLIGILFILAIIVVAFTMGLYSRDTGRSPWQWTAEDWHNWATFTRAKTRAAGEGLGREAKERTMHAWKWVGENTQQLYDRSKDLLARLGGEEKPAGVSPPSATTPTTPSTPSSTEEPSTGPATPSATPSSTSAPPDALDARSPNYRYGKEWLRKGIAEWKVSLIQPGASERAKGFFEKAISSFEAAGQELGDPAAVKDWLRSAREYLADTEERLQHIRQETATP
jgi:hypothetical protein